MLVKVCMCALRSLYIEMLEIYDALEIFAQWSMFAMMLYTMNVVQE